MAPYGGTVWAIEVGNDTLKALRLGAAGESVQVLGFGNIEYGKILAGGGVNATERDELIALGLRRFLRENSIGKDDVIISVPSQTSFARFVNLPPVEEKKIPQVVRLEAGMQIPFDMSEVQWDWQLMNDPGEEQVRVGIFAIKNEVVTKELEYFGNEDVPVSAVQMVPMALYNYVVYDRPELIKSDKEAVVVINIGTEATDLVVCSKSTVWQRCVPMGGNSFTRAIADAFKLSFEKAEKLKRTAAMSKYARQVFQAMRPVFSDFASEIQRSLGFFSSSQPDCKIAHVIALGGGTKLRGLLKYLGQTLQVPIEKPDTFKRLVLGEGVSAAQFSQCVGEFAVVYGLGLQGLGLGKIESNLLPRAIASSMALASKAKYVTMAAAAVLAIVAMGIGRTVFDSAKYSAQQDVRNQISSVARDAEDAKRKLGIEKSRESKSKKIIDEAYQLLKGREVIPEVVEAVLSVIPNEQNNKDQREIYEAFESGDVEKLLQTPRKEREQVFITNMSVYYVEDVKNAGFEKVRLRRSQGQSAADRSLFGKGGASLMKKTSSLAKKQPEDISKAAATDTESGPGGPGFVVVLTGYSPYKNIGQLMDPAGVGDNQEQWGMITRLMNLDALSDSNSPFELYGKTNITHFQLETGEVTVSGQTPAGIGIPMEINPGDEKSKQEVLVDPMTKEVISKVPLKDTSGRKRLDSLGRELYEVNDHWFILRFKLQWREGATLEIDESEDV